MSHAAMIKTLFADAQFYQLDGLIKLLRPLVNTRYRLLKVFTGLHDSSWLFDSGFTTTYVWIIRARGRPPSASGVMKSRSALSKHTR